MSRNSKGREHRPLPEKITDLARNVLDSTIRLPKFQRDFVWTRQQVLDLLDSIARGYPIGSFLLWKSTVNLASESTIAGLQVETPDDGEETVYLLDGCQRLSTICGALHWEPNADPDSFWNLVYELEEERFLHRYDLQEPPPSQVPLRLLDTPAVYFPRLIDLSGELQMRARALYERITGYEVATVTLKGTPLSEVGRIFERVNTRGTPLATVELVRAATWRQDFDLLDEIDGIRDVLASKHFALIDRKLVLRAIAAAAGKGFATANIEELPFLDPLVLKSAVGATQEAARRAVDFLTTEIGAPTAEALPYANQFAVVVELFRQVPRPTSVQYAAMRGWFWQTTLTGYYDGWNKKKMAADLAAIERFRHGAKIIEVQSPPLSTRLWTADQYRRDSAKTKALALMLAAAGPRDLRTGARIDSGRALAMTNEVQFHHFFPKAWLLAQATPYEETNLLVNIVMLTAISNQAVAADPPAAYLKGEIGLCGEAEMRRRLESLLISPQAFDAAMQGDYKAFVAARAETLLAWANDLTRGQFIAEEPGSSDPEVLMRGETAEVADTSTDDD
ncbi:MAG TPA: DUF262 domain-containing protein [Streptosporangiaceae bacterium]|nr:DUF262 domain-containing protein [Streptosporangiaceae bacterium]